MLHALFLLLHVLHLPELVLGSPAMHLHFSFAGSPVDDMRPHYHCRAGACFEKSSETLLLEKIRAPRGAGLHVRQEQANSSVGNTADATLSSACAAGSSATQQQKHTVKQQRLPLQSAQLTRPSGEGQGEGSALQQRDAVAQPCSAGVDVVASASDMQERRNGDVHDGKVFLDSVDCLDID